MSTIMLKQIYYFSYFKLKGYIRINKLLLISIVGFTTLIALMYGYNNILVFKTGSENFFKGGQNLLFRDALSNIILAFYLSFLSYSILKSATGANNPFITSEQDANFQILLPVNPFVTFFSCKIQNIIKNMVILLIVVFFFFGPLILMLNIPIYRTIPFYLNFFLGLELVSLISNLFYFIFSYFRSGKGWAIIFTEKDNYLVTGSILVIPLIFFQLFSQGQIPTFAYLSKFVYLPFVNIAISNTGLLFRSGIPAISYIGTFFIAIQVIILFTLNLILIRFLATSTELGDMLPILENMYSTKELFFGQIEHTNVNVSVTKVDKNAEFKQTNHLVSLIKKDWLFIYRQQDLRFNLIQIIGLPVILVITIVVKLYSTAYLGLIMVFLMAQLIGVTIDLLSRLYGSVSSNKDLLPVNEFYILQEYILFTILLLFPTIIVILASFNFLSFFLLVIITLVSFILKTLKVQSTFINLWLGMILSLIFFSLLL